MKNIIVDNIEYNVITNYKNAFDLEEFKNKLTDYFYEYDYIIGDWAYGKLRLKGFCKPQNKLFKEINDFENKNSYLKNNCAYDCKYFILEKVSK